MDVKHQIVPASYVSIPCIFAGINVNTPKIIVKIAINCLIYFVIGCKFNLYNIIN